MLAALERLNLTLNTDKCIFSTLAIYFIHFHVSSTGPLQSEYRCHCEHAHTYLSSTVGWMVYYIQFFLDYSFIVVALHQILKQDTAWDWTSSIQKVYSVWHSEKTPQFLTNANLLPPRLTNFACDAAIAVGVVPATTWVENCALPPVTSSHHVVKARGAYDGHCTRWLPWYYQTQCYWHVVWWPDIDRHLKEHLGPTTYQLTDGFTTFMLEYPVLQTQSEECGSDTPGLLSPPAALETQL